MNPTKYQDNAVSVNGYYPGESVGSRLADSLSPSDDGLNYLRNSAHVGTITQDPTDAGFPVEESESEDG